MEKISMSQQCKQWAGSSQQCVLVRLCLLRVTHWQTGCGSPIRTRAFFDKFRNNIASTQTETHINAHTYPQDHAWRPHISVNNPTLPHFYKPQTLAGLLLVRVTERTFISYHINTSSQRWLDVMFLTDKKPPSSGNARRVRKRLRKTNTSLVVL